MCKQINMCRVAEGDRQRGDLEVIPGVVVKEGWGSRKRGRDAHEIR